jgi:cytochrome P450
MCIAFDRDNPQWRGSLVERSCEHIAFPKVVQPIVAWNFWLHMKGKGMTFNLNDSTIRHNPYPFYAHLRATRPVTKARLPFVGEAWLVTCYEDVVDGLKRSSLSSDARNSASRMSRLADAWWMPKAFKAMQHSMVSLDGPDHHRLRSLVHQAFTPRRVEQLAGNINAIVDELLDQLAQKTRVDLLADYALPLPLTVISDMIGVREDDRYKFHLWSSKLLEVGAGDPSVFLRQIPNAFRMLRFFEQFIAQRTANPGNDLITALITAEDAGDRLSQDELIAMIFLLLLAGHETTVNLIGTGVLALLQHPAQLQQLREHPELIDSAIEELLRYGNPVEHGSARYALEDLEIGGQVIPKGSMILLLLSSANRDEQGFEHPEELDIARDPNRHLAFGLGIHYCLGAPLARLEGRIAIQKLIQRFPNLGLAVPAEQLEWRNTMAVRGLRSLPVVVK